MTFSLGEHQHAIVTRDLPELGLMAGDVGVVVHIHRVHGSPDPVGYMLEFFAVDGESLGEESVPADAVRAPSPTDRMHTRAA